MQIARSLLSVYFGKSLRRNELILNELIKYYLRKFCVLCTYWGFGYSPHNSQPRRMYCFNFIIIPTCAPNASKFSHLPIDFPSVCLSASMCVSTAQSILLIRRQVLGVWLWIQSRLHTQIVANFHSSAYPYKPLLVGVGNASSRVDERASIIRT